MRRVGKIISSQGFHFNLILKDLNFSKLKLNSHEKKIHTFFGAVYIVRNEY